MRISTARSASATASFCTRWLVAAALLGAAAATAEPPASALERSLEMELELAQTPALYLLLDAASARLDVKVRGVVLDSVAVANATLLLRRRGELDPAGAALPIRWRVIAVADPSPRQVVEAGELRPYAGDGEELTAAAKPQAAGPAPRDRAVAESANRPEPATRYRVPLDAGWELRIAPSVGRARWSNALALAAGRLSALGAGEPFRPPDVVALALSAEDARRIHHMFRPGVEILAVASTPAGREAESNP